MKKVLKFGCGSIVGLFVLLIVIGLIVGDDSSNTSSSDGTKTPATANKDKQGENKDSNEKIGIGQELVVEDVAFTVHGIEEITEISAANGYMKYKPESQSAVYLSVNLTVKNLSNEMIQTDSSFFKLIAENGAEYSPTTIPVADDKYFLFEGINPGLSLTGNVVFEVPPSLKGLDLHVQTGFWGTETGTINLN